MCYSSFALADSDSDTNTDSIKFCCQFALVSVDTCIQFYTSHLLLSLGVGLRQCKHTIRPDCRIGAKATWLPDVFIENTI